MSSPSPTRAEWVCQELKASFAVGHLQNDWPKRLSTLFGLRNSTAGGLLHPTTVFKPASDHPVLPNVTPARVVFTMETADWAVDFMRSVYARCRTSIRPGNEALTSRVQGLDGILKKLSEGLGY